MRALGNYILSGRLQAAAITGTLTLVSWFLPPLAFLVSGVPIGLVTLRRGAMLGVQVAAGAFLFISLIALLTGVPPAVAAGFAVGVWLPVWICALVLRNTESQGVMIMAAGGLGMAFVAAMHLAVEDTAGWWRRWFEAWLESNMPPEAAGQYQQVLDAAIPLLNAMMGSALVVSLSATLLAARWWQALLFNPGGFQREFHTLKLPRMLALPTLIAIIAAMTTEGTVQEIIRDLLVVTLFMFLFQGISAVHRTVAANGLSHFWLVGMYCLLVLVPHMVLFMACLGLADSWMVRQAPPGGGANGDGNGRAAP
jgi:hypothetical protein